MRGVLGWTRTAPYNYWPGGGFSYWPETGIEIPIIEIKVILEDNQITIKATLEDSPITVMAPVQGDITIICLVK